MKRNSVWVLAGVLLLVGAALWYETKYRKALKPAPNAPVQSATPQPDSSTKPEPQQTPSKRPASGELLIG